MAGRTTRRVTILFPPGLYKEVEDEARQQERSVEELVREAAMIRYGSGDDIGDPEDLEEEIVRG